MPGYEIQTECGDRWIASYQAGWPVASLLTADGKKIAVGQSESFLFTTCNSGFVCPFDLVHNPTPPAALSVYSALGAVTYEHGQPRSDDLGDFLHDVQLMDWTVPVAVDLMDKPADLKTVRQRTYNQIAAGSVAEVAAQFRAPSRLGDWRVSGGPQIVDWRGINLSRSAIGEWVVPGTERWRIRLEAESDAPLREVAIYDGTTRIHRYLPQGKTFSVEIDGLHDQQRALIAVVTDALGRRAFSGYLMVLDLQMYRTMCSDHQNSINCAFAKDAAGNTILYAPAWMQEKARLRNTVRDNPPSRSSLSRPWWTAVIRPIFPG